MKYVLILGMDHSGSTLLTFLLDSHPEIVSVGEICRVGRIIPDQWKNKTGMCSCGKPYYYCDFWNRVLAGLAVRGGSLDSPDFIRFELFERPILNYLYLRLRAQRWGQALIRLCLIFINGRKNQADRKLASFVASVLEVSEKNIFLDASKSYLWLYSLSHNPHFDLKVLNLYRDGRAVLNSWIKYFPEKTIDALIQRWVENENRREKSLEFIPAKQIYSMKYKELCISPQKILSQIFHFLEVEPEVDVTSGYKSQADHHIIGNQMRLSPNELITLDESWKDNLSQEKLQIFEKLGGHINCKLGYDDNQK